MFFGGMFGHVQTFTHVQLYALLQFVGPVSLFGGCKCGMHRMHPETSQKQADSNLPNRGIPKGQLGRVGLRIRGMLESAS